jgi:hypothetical protein
MINDFYIIYIIGAARSGTTLLDVLLGNGNGIFSAGELNRFPKRNGIPHDARDAEVTHFWNKVSSSLETLTKSTWNDCSRSSKRYEYHSAFYHLIIPFTNKQSFNVYSAFQKELFQKVGENALKEYNKNVIVDSSKYPMRAFFLSKIFGKNISFVYIKKNPSSVVESFQKKDIEQPPKSRLMANLYLISVNALAILVIRRLRKKHNISILDYEKLQTAPIESLTEIENDLNLDFSCSKKLIEESLPLKVGLLFDGNRLRLEKNIVFRKGAISKKSEKMINRFFLPLHKLIWYGWIS